MLTVCVVVPTRNSTATLERCLASIRAQTHPCSLIVVDNASVDGTLTVAKRFAEVLLTGGPERSAQRNIGARATTADVVGFIDSDMVLDPDVVAEAVAIIERGVDAVIIPEWTTGHGYWARVRAFERATYSGTSIEAARFFRHSTFDQVGGFDEQLVGPEDWDLTLRLQQVGTISRTVSGIEHSEGHVRYLAASAKKAYYADGLLRFTRKHGRRGLGIAADRTWLRRPWQLIATDPGLGAGVIALKVGEMTAVLWRVGRLALRGDVGDQRRHRPPSTVDLSERLRGTTVSVAIPAYGEGAGIVMTLASLHRELERLGLVDEVPVLLSDSSPTSETVDEATTFASTVGLRLSVDRSDRRRPLKEALNTVFERSTSDIIVILCADVAVVPGSLAALLGHLLDEPRPVVAVGAVRSHPGARGWRRRAGIWQIETVWHLARHLSRDAVRAEGALWGAWRDFYAMYRYPVGQGAIADDVELARALRRRGLPVRNAYDAQVYKIPPASLHDFALSQLRSQYVSSDEAPGTRALFMGAYRALADPLGAICYLRARVWTRRHAATLASSAQTELWASGSSTKALPGSKPPPH